MICVSIGNVQLEQAVRVARAHQLVEFRLDLLPVETMEDLDILLAANRNAIVTFRPGSGRDRDPFFIRAISSGTAYVDLEIEADAGWLREMIATAKDSNTTVIVSHHNYQFTPETPDLVEIRDHARHTGACLCKIATHCRDTRDAVRLIGLLNRDPENLIVLGMGPAGAITRIAGPMLGSPFTFAYPDGEAQTAPGQLPVSIMTRILQYLGASVD